MDSHLESESARLIPEEKKEFKPAQPTPNFPKGGMSFTESAYKGSEQSEIVNEAINKHRWESDFKEFEDLAAKQRDIEPEIAEVLAKHGHELFESSEPQEKRCKACEIERNDEQVKQMPEHTCKKGSPMDIAQPKSAPSESQEDKFEAFFAEFQERYAFQVPYNGTNEFYNQKKLDQAESFKMDMKFAWNKIFTRKPE